MPAICGTQAAAQSSQDKATTTSLSAANPRSAKLGLQSRLSSLGLTLQTTTGQGLFPIPTFQNKAHSSEGCVALALLKKHAVFRGWEVTCFWCRGAPSHTKVGFRSSLKFTTGWGPPRCSVR